MSRLNPEITSNPVQRYFEWDGSNGFVRWWNKAVEKNIEEEMPFTFLLLDEVAKITGWSDENDTSIYSNEVHNITQEKFFVRTQNGDHIAEGYYTDDNVKNAIKAKGGKYTTVLYIAYHTEDNGLQIGKLEVKGVALRSWMEFRKESGKAIYEDGIQIHDYETGQKGGITYCVPQFRLQEVSEQAHETAKDLTQTVVDYLEAKKKQANRGQAEQVERPQEDYPDGQPKPSGGDVYSEPKGNEPPHPASGIDEDDLDIDDDLPF